MAQEIERKFLVKGDFKPYVKKAMHIVQAYISSNPERTVRVRIKDDKGYITVKGMGDAGGMRRFEWEKEISLAEAQDLLQVCEHGRIDKVRYLVDVGSHTFEVDEFRGDNEGLIMAEVELSSEDEAFDKPAWLGRELTGDVRYYNSSLMKQPYKCWSSQEDSPNSTDTVD